MSYFIFSFTTAELVQSFEECSFKSWYASEKYSNIYEESDSAKKEPASR